MFIENAQNVKKCHHIPTIYSMLKPVRYRDDNSGIVLLENRRATIIDNKELSLLDYIVMFGLKTKQQRHCSS